MAALHALCVDVGTSMIKAVAYDRDGRELAVAREATTVLRPHPGHAEQDMAEVRRGIFETLRRVREQVGGTPELLALTAQGDGCWLVDADGAPVRPAVLWSDGRNPRAVEGWERDGTLRRAFALNGSLSFPGLPNAILPWLRDHEPEALGRAARALSCGGFAFAQLTGELAMDASDASAPLLDLRTGAWSAELLELFDLTWARGLLPEVRDMDGRVGALTARAAGELGLSAGLPVVMAPYDIASTAIGVGATGPGQACTILGTTLCTEVMTAAPDTTGEPSGFTIAMGVEDRYLRAFPTLAGTEVIGWLLRLLGRTDPADVARLAAQVDPRDAGPVVLPYLSPAGERAPFLEPSARGTILGLTLEHGPEHLCRAVLEGLSFVVRDCLEAATAGEVDLRLCGGGAASDAWCQLIADVTGTRALRCDDAELGAKGALITGLVATGAEPDLETATARLVRLRDRFAPDPARAALYDERFAAFRALRRQSVGLWRTMAGAQEATDG